MSEPQKFKQSEKNSPSEGSRANPTSKLIFSSEKSLRKHRVFTLISASRCERSECLMRR